MARTKKKQKRPRLLSNTRPTGAKKTQDLPSRATRFLIRNHHTLQKHLKSALARNDSPAVAHIEAQLASSGGLAKYQQASIQGQSLQRGGDSSRVLVEWLLNDHPAPDIPRPRLRILEVGALRVDNAIARTGFCDMTRIDLKSQHSDIKTQDFMQQSFPTKPQLEREGFDILSLSLVVNYVGDAIGRGEMLKRVSSFLRPCSPNLNHFHGLLPALFLVLPAPCVMNSRHLNEERLEAMMLSLGYRKTKRKLSAKLVYYLWTYDESSGGKPRAFRKEELRKGGSRNNFAIVMA